MAEENTETTETTNQTSSEETTQTAETTETKAEETPSETKNQSTEEGDKSGEDSSGEAPEPLTQESLTLPEGLEFDSELGPKFLEVMNNAELSPAERANALLELQADSIRTASEKISEDWKATREDWVKQCKDHAEYGGEKFDASLGKISDLLNEFGSQELREEVFDWTGAGDNPHMFEFLAKIADAMAEGKTVSGSPASQKQSAAQRMYPSMKG